MKKYWRAALGMLVISAQCEWAAESAIQFRLLRGTARVVNAGGSIAEPELLLEAIGSEDSLKKLSAMTLKAVDETKEKPQVQVLAVHDASNFAPGKRVWRIALASAKIPANTTLRRMLGVEWGGSKQSLPYLLSSVPKPALDLQVSKVAAEWNAASADCVRLRLSAAGDWATGIGITSTLIEDESKRVLSTELYLATEQGKRATGTELEAAINLIPAFD